MENRSLQLSVSEFVDLTNQVLEGAYPVVAVEGEVASFGVNQGKFVFFDLKDADATVNCFMMLWQLRVPIEDGMKVIVSATPKLTARGKFSLTVRSIRPSGEGSLKKSFELLKAKLDREGLFAVERKRVLPVMPQRIAVISSTDAAGYADFVRIVNDRWGGLDIEVAHTAVQGEGAADQIIGALRYFNEQPLPREVVVIIRGGGSADDLATYNDEQLVRAIAASRIPTLVGVGHEIDTSLADLAADVRAATPSNAAQLLVPDRRELIASLQQQLRLMATRAERSIDTLCEQQRGWLERALEQIDRQLSRQADLIRSQRAILASYDPMAVLGRGYAVVRGQVAVGASIEVETKDTIITAEVTHVKKR